MPAPAESRSRRAAILGLLLVPNAIVVHYSVEWWNTLHQGPTVAKFGAPSIHLSMLLPLLVMAAGFKLYYLSVMLTHSRNEMLERERNSAWVRELVDAR
jgi:heme exporter protein C